MAFVNGTTSAAEVVASPPVNGTGTLVEVKAECTNDVDPQAQPADASPSADPVNALWALFESIPATYQIARTSVHERYRDTDLFDREVDVAVSSIAAGITGARAEPSIEKDIKVLPLDMEMRPPRTRNGPGASQRSNPAVSDAESDDDDTPCYNGSRVIHAAVA